MEKAVPAIYRKLYRLVSRTSWNQRGCHLSERFYGATNIRWGATLEYLGTRKKRTYSKVRRPKTMTSGAPTDCSKSMVSAAAPVRTLKARD